MRLYHLLIVPVLSTAVLAGVACKEGDTRSKDKDSIYTYEISAEWADGKKRKIAARYTYGGRAASMSSSSGKVKTTAKTAGAKSASIDAGGAFNGKVKCKIVVKGGGRTRTIENTGTKSAVCKFNV